MILFPGKSVGLDSEIPIDARIWRNDPSVFKWCRQYSLITQSDHDAWLERLKSDHSIKMFSIVTTSSQPVGVCGLTSIDKHNQTAEFSLYIAPKEQSKGYGKDALWSLLNHGFFDLNLNRIWGETFDGNPALDMFIDLGMKEEGTLRASYFRSGKYINSKIVSMLRDEFR